MRVLLGTTNPSKVKRFSELLKGYDIEFMYKVNNSQMA